MEVELTASRKNVCWMDAAKPNDNLPFGAIPVASDEVSSPLMRVDKLAGLLLFAVEIYLPAFFEGWQRRIV